jgi:TetR/AcrR family transcriptional regulator, regulator of autoinduction and epiphytic fitness
MLELLEAGDLQPTAARIAAGAGISERLIYHHFDDLEALLGAVADRRVEQVMARVTPIDTDLPLDARIDALVSQRSSILEWITPVRRASAVHEPFSAELRRHRDELNRFARNELARVFASELEPLAPAERRELLGALDAATAWGFWDTLRTSGLSAAVARRAMRRTVAALLATP